MAEYGHSFTHAMDRLEQAHGIRQGRVGLIGAARGQTKRGEEERIQIERVRRPDRAI
jgi:hypothetical protein